MYNATYRIQLGPSFGWKDAEAILQYLSDLGVSHLYLSPVFACREGSEHGYDIVDYSRLNPELGSHTQFELFLRGLRRKGMGVLQDFVPNHMAISVPSNRWWYDILEKGPDSPYSGFFDIDWNAPDSRLKGKVLLPILDEDLECKVKRGGVAVVLDEEGLCLRIDGAILPLAPRSLFAVLDCMIEGLWRERRGHPAGEKEMALLVEKVRASRGAVRALRELNSDPQRLRAIVEAQHYRLSHWREASNLLNYRRFFDINHLAGVRVEDPRVFEKVHELVGPAVERGWIGGLRIDHPDGLADPAGYLRKLRRTILGGRPLFVEKILTGDERLRADWGADGTTGYEFLNLLNGLFVDASGLEKLRRTYRRFTGRRRSWNDTVYRSKLYVMDNLLRAEVDDLARRLQRISSSECPGGRIGLQTLRRVLRHVIASFPVYRSYLTPRSKAARGADRKYILAALASARWRAGRGGGPALDLMERVLVKRRFKGLSHAQKAETEAFVTRFQQVTAPVMAKGLEDTAFYRHYPLASLNEIGGCPELTGTSARRFHAFAARRLRETPMSLNATATHDMMRGEDARARVNVLSEIPERWDAALRRWRTINRKYKTLVKGRAVPDANEEYLIYQTLVAVWPFGAASAREHGDLVERICAYMTKALREAKVHSNWIRPDEVYEDHVRSFVRGVLRRGENRAFLADFAGFHRPLARVGIWNSLTQTLVKIASPGIPDIYQGTELWDFSLVDPDNRRPVDFRHRRAALSSVKRAEGRGGERPLRSFLSTPGDGRVKMYLIRSALKCRRRRERVFQRGGYVPLPVAGEWRNNSLGFARVLGGDAVIATAGRFFVGLGSEHRDPVGSAVWGRTSVSLVPEVPRGLYRDVFTRRELEFRGRGQCKMPLDEVLSLLPVALMERVHD